MMRNSLLVVCAGSGIIVYNFSYFWFFEYRRNLPYKHAFAVNLKQEGN